MPHKSTFDFMIVLIVEYRIFNSASWNYRVWRVAKLRFKSGTIFVSDKVRFVNAEYWNVDTTKLPEVWTMELPSYDLVACILIPSFWVSSIAMEAFDKKYMRQIKRGWFHPEKFIRFVYAGLFFRSAIIPCNPYLFFSCLALGFWHFETLRPHTEVKIAFDLNLEIILKKRLMDIWPWHLKFKQITLCFGALYIYIIHFPIRIERNKNDNSFLIKYNRIVFLFSLLSSRASLRYHEFRCDEGLWTYIGNQNFQIVGSMPVNSIVLLSGMFASRWEQFACFTQGKYCEKVIIFWNYYSM